MNSSLFCFPGRKHLLLALLFTLPWMLPSSLMAQAGSGFPVITTLAFNDSRDPGIEAPSYRRQLAPSHLWQIPEEQTYVLWVELHRGRLHLLEQAGDGAFIVRRVYPVSIGKNGYGKEVEGDKRTPVGAYYFTRFLEDDELLDFYGPGAYPINYPNAWDRRLQRTGYGIWLHGLPTDVSQRPYLDSDGCVVLDNRSLLDMAGFIDVGVTQIVMTDEDIDWQPVQRLQEKRSALASSFNAWRESWESIDIDRYLSFYAGNFSDHQRSRDDWQAYRRYINGRKSSIDVDISQLSFIAVPGEDDLVSVRYYQRYDSSHYDNSRYRWQGWKEQLWQETEAGWHIIYEGEAW